MMRFSLLGDLRRWRSLPDHHFVLMYQYFSYTRFDALQSRRCRSAERTIELQEAYSSSECDSTSSSSSSSESPTSDSDDETDEESSESDDSDADCQDLFIPVPPREHLFHCFECPPSQAERKVTESSSDSSNQITPAAEEGSDLSSSLRSDHTTYSILLERAGYVRSFSPSSGEDVTNAVTFEGQSDSEEVPNGDVELNSM